MKPPKMRTRDGLWLLISGMAIGWMVGLSASPTVHLVITGVLGAATAIVGVFAGVEFVTSHDNPANVAEIPKTRAVPSVYPLPLTLLLLGLIPGSIVGIVARTQEWFGARPDNLIAQWSRVGIAPEMVAQRLFDQLYPPASTTGSNSAEATPGKQSGESEKENDKASSRGSVHGGALFSIVPASECKQLAAALSVNETRRILRGSSVRNVRLFEASCRDDQSLKAAVEILICARR